LVNLSADTTVTPAASPTNVSNIEVNAPAPFKGRLEADPVSGIVRVTNAHPAGSYVVTVTAFDGDATSNTAFTLTVLTPSTCNPVTFANPNQFTAGSAPNAVAVGDFNRDGIQDLAVTNFGGGDVSIFRGDGNGGFGPPTNFPLTIGSGSPEGIFVADVWNCFSERAMAPSRRSVSFILGAWPRLATSTATPSPI
jgi:hypothetical protein